MANEFVRSIRIGILAATGATLALIGSVAMAEPATVSVRTLQLKGGGCLQVVTRYHDSDYHAAQTIEVDPIIGTCFPVGARTPIVVDGFVEPRKRGFAPCLSSGKDEDRKDCVDGSTPTLLDRGSPAHFSFAFNRLFNTTALDAEGAGTDEKDAGTAFGYAAFLVTVQVIAENGTREVLSFPVTVTVHQRGEGERAQEAPPSRTYTSSLSLQKSAQTLPASAPAAPVD